MNATVPDHTNNRLGYPRRHFRSCESTNLIGKQLAEAGAAHGTTITAAEQSAGRGRQGRKWVAPADTALLLSVIARPLAGDRRFAPLSAAVAVAETCEQLAGVDCRLKWPNDVWIDGRKVAGILIEGRPNEQHLDQSWLVIGIGLNTSINLAELPDDLQLTATTLGLDHPELAYPQLTRTLDRWLDAPKAEIFTAWRERDALLGRTIAWQDQTGVAAGIDDEGGLLVQLPDGNTTALQAGEVHLSIER